MAKIKFPRRFMLVNGIGEKYDLSVGSADNTFLSGPTGLGLAMEYEWERADDGFFVGASEYGAQGAVAGSLIFLKDGYVQYRKFLNFIYKTDSLEFAYLPGGEMEPDEATGELNFDDSLYYYATCKLSKIEKSEINKNYAGVLVTSVEFTLTSLWAKKVENTIEIKADKNDLKYAEERLGTDDYVGWTMPGGAITQSTTTHSINLDYVSGRNSLGLITGNVYFLYGGYGIDRTNSLAAYVQIAVGTSVLYNNSTPLGTVFTCDATATPTTNTWCRLRLAGTTSLGREYYGPIHISAPRVLDLTLWFGAGNEPSDPADPRMNDVREYLDHKYSYVETEQYKGHTASQRFRFDEVPSTISTDGLSFYKVNFFDIYKEWKFKSNYSSFAEYFDREIATIQQTVYHYNDRPETLTDGAIATQLAYSGSNLSAAIGEWSGIYGSVSTRTDGGITVTLEGQHSSFYMEMLVGSGHTKAPTTIAGHKYLVKCDVMQNRSGSGELGIRIALANGTITRNYALIADDSSIASGGWHLNNLAIITATTSEQGLRVGFSSSGYMTPGDSFSIRNLSIVDLTLWYGAGNEPSTINGLNLYSGTERRNTSGSGYENYSMALGSGTYTMMAEVETDYEKDYPISVQLRYDDGERYGDAFSFYNHGYSVSSVTTSYNIDTLRFHAGEDYATSVGHNYLYRNITIIRGLLTDDYKKLEPVLNYLNNGVAFTTVPDMGHEIVAPLSFRYSEDPVASSDISIGGDVDGSYVLTITPMTGEEVDDPTVILYGPHGDEIGRIVSEDLTVSHGESLEISTRPGNSYIRLYKTDGTSEDMTSKVDPVTNPFGRPKRGQNNVKVYDISGLPFSFAIKSYDYYRSV